MKTEILNCNVLHCLRLLELAHLLDMVHEVSPIHILHDKVETILWSHRKRHKRRGGRG